MLSKLMVCLFLMVAMMGCSSPAPDFQLMPTDALAVEHVVEIDINNCGSPFPHIQWRDWSESAEAELGVDNLQPTGGEPFTSIRSTILAQHGQPLASTPFTVPPNTHVVYTFTVESTRFRGEVVGAAINAEKVHPTLPTYYSYLAPHTVMLAGEETRPCA